MPEQPTDIDVRRSAEQAVGSNASARTPGRPATDSAPRGREPHNGSDRPRTMPAGHALLVMVGALLIGLFLNAGDIWETANRQEFGLQRRLALAVADPVWHAARLLRLTGPRDAVDDALGRPPTGPDEEVRLAAPTTTVPTTAPVTTAATTTTTEAPGAQHRVVAPADPLRVYVGGDSMVGQFGPMLENRADRSRLVDTQVVYEFESGLTRPDFVDWPDRLRGVATDFDPEVVVLFFGGNDAQAIRIDATWHDFGTPEWVEEYRSRVGAVMDQLTSDGREVYWVGMPIVRSESFREKVAAMNEIYRSEAAARDLVTYVDSWSQFVGPDGGYAEYLPDADGDVVDMRLNDGVHLTTAGGIKLADHVFDLIATAWGFETEAGSP